DPLLHLLRNACDHGIEPAAARTTAGKPERGVVRVRASHEGNRIVVQVSDDGAGIDRDRVRACAVKAGLVTVEEAAALDEGPLLGLLFRPGFSTARQVSEVSGRGVGLDAVKTRVQQLRGSVAVESTPGRGTTFTLRLPMTLALVKALLLRAGGQT